MKDLASLRRRAIVLMREALTLLDEAGESGAACHLQMAHDIVARIPPAKPENEPPEEYPGSSEMAADPALVRAIGGALAVLATLMARSGIAPVDEIANVLGIYAVASAETSAEEGMILGCWGAILRDIADEQRRAM